MPKDLVVRTVRRLFRRQTGDRAPDSEKKQKIRWLSLSTPQRQDKIAEAAVPDDDYVPKNKAFEHSDKVGNVVSVFNQPHQKSYYGQTPYALSDGRKFSRVKAKRVPIPRVKEPPSHEFILAVTSSRLPASKGNLLVPFGFAADSYWGENIDLFQEGRALYYEMQSLRDFVIRLKPVEPFDLSDEERAVLTTVENPPALELFPMIYQRFIRDLQQERLVENLTDMEVATRLKIFLHKQMKYEVDSNSTEGALQFCWTGTVQCDGASLVYVTLLRSFFKIPCEAVSGVMGAFDPKKPGESLVIDSATPHMFVAIYDAEERIFKIFDPTPPVPTRPMPKPRVNSPYRQWSVASENPLEEPMRTDTSQYWKELFANLEKGEWKSYLGTLHQALNENLDPQLATERKAVEDLTRLTIILGEQPLKEAVGLALSHHDSRQRFLHLKRLEILATYGPQYSESPKLYGRLERSVRRILRFVDQSHRSPEDLLQARLPGEFSRQAQRQTGGDMTIFFQLASLHQFIQLERAKSPQSYPSLRYDKSITPTDDEEIDFEIAEDFEGIESFERQGFPPTFDGTRVAAGDMLRRIWRDPVQNGPARPVHERPDNELTIMLVDLSWSMSKENKGLVRDRAVQMSIDELLSSGAKGMMVILGYRDVPEPPIFIRTREEAEQYFRSMMVKGEFYKSDEGNNTATAFKVAVDVFKELQDEFSKVNLRLLTDGEETLDLELMRDVRRTIGWENELNLTAVTIATGNKELEKFVKNSKMQGLVSDGLFVHLGREQIHEIVSGRAIREDCSVAHLLPANLDDIKRVPEFLWRELENFK